MGENQRVRLTKQLLKNSLINLLSEANIHKISVRDICKKADINRTTFYKYYGSQYDLLSDMENDVITEIDSYLDINEIGIKDGSNLVQLTKIIVFLNNNIELCRILFNNNIDPAFPEKLINLPKIKQTISKFSTYTNEEELDYLFVFIVNGGFSLMCRWLNKENRETPDEIAALINDAFLKFFGII